jgi:hypothetical protein
VAALVVIVDIVVIILSMDMGTLALAVAAGVVVIDVGIVGGLISLLCEICDQAVLLGLVKQLLVCQMRLSLLL